MRFSWSGLITRFAERLSFADAQNVNCAQIVLYWSKDENNNVLIAEGCPTCSTGTGELRALHYEKLCCFGILDISATTSEGAFFSESG